MIENRKFEKEWIILFALVLVKLLIHLGTNAFAGYGIFRDELYYLACSHHLDLGYVDQPPLSIYILTLSRLLFGSSLFALRLLPAFAGAFSVLFTGLMVRKLGGKVAAMVIACLSMIAAPILLAMNGVYSMNSFDILLWTLAAYFFIRIIKEENPRLWPILGLITGLGLLNKISMGFFAAGLFFAVILNKERKHLTTKWPYLAGLIAFALFLPFIIWNLMHDFAHLEFIRNATMLKYRGLTAIDFISGQFLLLNPAALPVWLAGLYYYFFDKEGIRFRHMGIIFATVFAIFIINGHSKAEYLSPAYPMLFAAGGVQLEKLTKLKYWQWLKYALPAVIISAGLLLAPLVLPILPVKTYIGYTKAIGFEPESPEAKELTELPQHYADMFGWENMAKRVSEVYTSLPPEEKPKTIVYASNYGRAGAIEYFSRKYELPPVFSPHNNYWIWSRAHTNKDYTTVIIIGGSLEDHLNSLEEVERAGMIRCRYCMPYENNLTVYIGRKLKRTLKEIWQSAKHYE